MHIGVSAGKDKVNRNTLLLSSRYLEGIDPMQKINTNDNTRFDKGLVIKLDAGLLGINLQSLQTK